MEKEFISFLGSLETKENKPLIESVKKGFKACFESQFTTELGKDQMAQSLESEYIEDYAYGAKESKRRQSIKVQNELQQYIDSLTLPQNTHYIIDPYDEGWLSEEEQITIEPYKVYFEMSLLIIQLSRPEDSYYEREEKEKIIRNFERFINPKPHPYSLIIRGNPNGVYLHTNTHDIKTTKEGIQYINTFLEKYQNIMTERNREDEE